MNNIFPIIGQRFSAVTPSDTAKLTRHTNYLFVGGAGNVAVEESDTGSATTFTGVAAGSILPIRVRAVLATGTTATNIVAIT